VSVGERGRWAAGYLVQQQACGLCSTHTHLALVGMASMAGHPARLSSGECAFARRRRHSALARPATLAPGRRLAGGGALYRASGRRGFRGLDKRTQEYAEPRVLPPEFPVVFPVERVSSVG